MDPVVDIGLPDGHTFFEVANKLAVFVFEELPGRINLLLYNRQMILILIGLFTPTLQKLEGFRFKASRVTL